MLNVMLRTLQVSTDEWVASVAALMELGKVNEALATLHQALEAVSPADHAQFWGLLEHWPEEVRVEPEALRAQCRLMGNTKKPKELAIWIRQQQAAGREHPFLSVYLAWALAESGDFASAWEQAEQVAALTFPDFEQNLLWRTQGRLLGYRGDPNWAQPFQQALAHCHESPRRRLFTLIEYAAGLGRANDHIGTIQALSEAQELAVKDPMLLRVHELLGLAYIRAGEFAEAERHLLELQRLARQKKPAQRLLGHALLTLAVPRRALGEWDRAEQLYLEALKWAVHEGDELLQQRALRGLGYTRRLAGRPLGALEAFEQGARLLREERETGRSSLLLDIAAVLAGHTRLNEKDILDKLDRAGPLTAEGLGRAAVVRAELARRRGDMAQAQQQLREVDCGTLWAREEAHLFPELFALLPPPRQPQPLPRTTHNTVRLQAIGPIQVTVNGRPVRPITLATVLLAAFLQEGPYLSKDRLSEVLDDGKPRSRRQAEQRVSKAVRALRTALGWDRSVQTEAGGYALAAAARWEYDVSEARADAKPITSFLQGFHLPWVTETEQLLSMQD